MMCIKCDVPIEIHNEDAKWDFFFLKAVSNQRRHETRFFHAIVYISLYEGRIYKKAPVSKDSTKVMKTYSLLKSLVSAHKHIFKEKRWTKLSTNF